MFKDELLEQTDRALKYENAGLRNVINLRHWIENSGNISRVETAFLDHENDIIAIGPPSSDEVPSLLQGPLEDMIILVSRLLNRVCNATSQPNSWLEAHD